MVGSGSGSRAHSQLRVSTVPAGGDEDEPMKRDPDKVAVDLDDEAVEKIGGRSEWKWVAYKIQRLAPAVWASNLLQDGVDPEVRPGGFCLSGARVHKFLWCASARAYEANRTLVQTSRAQRTSTQCVFTGVWERLRYFSPGCRGIRWRRLVIRSEDVTLRHMGGVVKVMLPASSSSAQYVGRPWIDWSQTDESDKIFNSIFRGEPGVDYIDLFDAPVDSLKHRLLRRVYRDVKPRPGETVMSDWVVSKMGLPGGEHLTFNDDPTGDVRWSVTGRGSGGDIYVLDIMQVLDPSDQQVEFHVRGISSVSWREPVSS